MNPLAEYLVETRRESLVVDELCIFLWYKERLGDGVRNIFSNEDVRVEVGGTDLL